MNIYDRVVKLSVGNDSENGYLSGISYLIWPTMLSF